MSRTTARPAVPTDAPPDPAAPRPRRAGLPVALARIAILLALLGPAARPASAQQPAPAPSQAAAPAAAAAPAPAPAGVPPAPASPIANQEQMGLVFDDFFKVGLDLEKPLAVHGLVLKRDTMEMNLADGTIYLAQPVAGRITGAYFTGRGSIHVTLPNTFDRKLMQADYGRPDFAENFTEAVLRFDDDSERELRAGGKPGTATGDPMTTWNDRLRIDAYAEDLQVDFLETLLNGLKTTTFFTAEVLARDGKAWFRYRHNGHLRIEDGIYLERALGAAGKRWYAVVSRFHRPEDYDPKGNYDVMPASDTKDVTALRNVEMTIDIPNTKAVQLDAHLTVEALREGVRLVRFDLLNNLDAATWDTPGRQVNTTLVANAEGTALPYIHRWHQLLVLLPKALPKGASTVVHVKITEDTIIQLTDHSYGIYTSFPWFPKIGYLGGRYTTDWTVKTQKPLQATGTGDMVKEWQEGDLNCSRWKSDVPVQLASFIFGDFKATDGTFKRESPGGGDVALRLWTIQGGTQHFKGNPQSVLFNISEGMKRYESIFGPFPYASLDIAEMAHYLNFAQSPAGVLLVSSVEVGSTLEEDDEGGVHVLNVEEQGGLGKMGGGGVGDQFVYHELAHQWWGHQIGWASDEDEWISESWAEYSASLVIAAIDHGRFELMRDKWRQRAVLADPFGTISTAYRSRSIEHPNERTFLLYDKGPCVVHMLRTWMGWDKFSKYVNTIQTKYKGTNINTDTLAREASAAMGYDMFPFFDQWVRDKGIPKVHWSWSVSPDTDGKQIVKLKFRQEDAENFKILMVPITFDFGKGEPVIVPKPLLKAETEILVKVPSVPKSVKMDTEVTQLATFIADGK
ncbi:MAG TPA: M1 family aminopeptidase [Patescibacteria group bacterium]|nr:M1 family aminopeptidase [Patescibacteria group bacterium]